MYARGVRPRQASRERQRRTSAPVAVALVVLPAAGLAEVGHRAELGPERLAGVPARVEVVDGLGGLELEVEPGVDGPDEVVAQVVADVELKQVAELSELAGRGVGRRVGGGGKGEGGGRASVSKLLLRKQPAATRVGARARTHMKMSS